MADTSNAGMGILERLSSAPYGAYGVDLDQTIVFWNAQAEEILGYTADEVIGRKCYEAVQVLDLDGTTPICGHNCPAIVAANRGYIPPVASARMVSAAGLQKRVTMFPLIAADEAGDPVLIHMFQEIDHDASNEDVPVHHPLTSREIEVLSLLAAGLRPVEIARQLFIAVTTVRKHISNAAEKLDSRGIMATVLTAQRLRLI